MLICSSEDITSAQQLQLKIQFVWVFSSRLSINPYISLLQATSVHKVGDQIHSPKHCPMGELLLLLALRDTAEWDHHVAILNFWYIATSELNPMWTKLAPFLPQSVVKWGRKASDTVDGIGVYVVYCCLLGLSCPIPDLMVDFRFHFVMDYYMKWWAWKKNPTKTVLAACLLDLCPPGPNSIVVMVYSRVYNLLKMAWFCPRTLGALVVIFLLGLAIKSVQQKFPLPVPLIIGSFDSHGPSERAAGIRA